MVILSCGTSRIGDMVKVKNRKESILKRAQSIIKISNIIADSGAKSANRRSTRSDTSGGDLGIFKNGDRICTAHARNDLSVASCAVIIELKVEDIINVKAVKDVSLHENNENNENQHALVGFLYTTL